MVSVGVGTRGSAAGWRWALAAVDSAAFGAALYGPRLRGGRAVVCFIMAVRMEERRKKENIDAANKPRCSMENKISARPAKRRFWQPPWLICPSSCTGVLPKFYVSTLDTNLSVGKRYSQDN